jgi:hypothetical protein
LVFLYKIANVPAVNCSRHNDALNKNNDEPIPKASNRHPVRQSWWVVKFEKKVAPSITMIIIQSHKKFAQMQVVSAFLVRVESAAFDMQKLQRRGGPEQIEEGRK